MTGLKLGGMRVRRIGFGAMRLSAQDINPAGPAGGVYDAELFAEDRGRATIFLPCDPAPQPIGRVSTTVIPPAELATIVHLAPHTDIDRTDGALAAYVTQHAPAVDGPIREYYLIGPSETQDDSLWRTEVGWPIFQTRVESRVGQDDAALDPRGDVAGVVRGPLEQQQVVRDFFAASGLQEALICGCSKHPACKSRLHPRPSRLLAAVGSPHSPRRSRIPASA
jgi:effector-binding domain-containing protein